MKPTNGIEAVEQLREALQPDLVTMDIVMPKKLRASTR